METEILKQRVALSKIAQDYNFKISKPGISQELVSSLKNNGLLETPYLIKKDKSHEEYIPFTCHKRLEILKEAGMDFIDAFILNRPSLEVFKKNALLKIFRGEVGPAGKMRVIFILRKIFALSEEELLNYNRNVLKVPQELLSDLNFQERFLSLPTPLLDYIDERDVPFKTIRDLCLLEDKILSFLDRCVGNIQIRLNIFKSIIEYLFDIQRSGNFSNLDLNSQNFNDDRELFSFIFSLRYPDYVQRKQKLETIIKRLSGEGLSFDLPEYFERDFVTIKLIMKKGDGLEKLQKRMERIKQEDISEIFSLF